MILHCFVFILYCELTSGPVMVRRQSIILLKQTEFRKLDNCMSKNTARTNQAICVWAKLYWQCLFYMGLFLKFTALLDAENQPLTNALFGRDLAEAQIHGQTCCSGLRNNNTKIMGFSSATEGGVCYGSLRTPLNQFLAGGQIQAGVGCWYQLAE